MSAVETPCIGICSTIYGDEVCRGCKRYYDEIIQWNGMPVEAHQLIFERIDQIVEQVLQGQLQMVDVEALKTACDHHKVRINPMRSPYYWAYSILYYASDELDFKNCGFVISVSHDQVESWLEQVDEQIYEQAVALWEAQGAVDA